MADRSFVVFVGGFSWSSLPDFLGVMEGSAVVGVMGRDDYVANNMPPAS